MLSVTSALGCSKSRRTLPLGRRCLRHARWAFHASENTMPDHVAGKPDVTAPRSETSAAGVARAVVRVGLLCTCRFLPSQPITHCKKSADHTCEGCRTFPMVEWARTRPMRPQHWRTNSRAVSSQWEAPARSRYGLASSLPLPGHSTVQVSRAASEACARPPAPASAQPSSSGAGFCRHGRSGSEARGPYLMYRILDLQGDTPPRAHPSLSLSTLRHLTPPSIRYSRVAFLQPSVGLTDQVHL